MFENIDILLAIDPTYLALFAGMSLAVTQVVKTVFPKLANYAVAMNGIFALVFAALLVEWSGGVQGILVQVFVLAYLIASSASGTYSWAKSKDVNIKFPDYSDEQ